MRLIFLVSVVITVASTGHGAVEENPDPERTRRFETHTVKSGDTLAAIAKAHGLSLTALAELNAIDDPNLIRPGQELRVRELETPAVSEPAGKSQDGPASTPDAVPVEWRQVHVVEAGDTYSGIAKRYGVHVSWLMDANPGVDARRLRVGQKIRVSRPPVPGVSGNPSEPGTVVAGDRPKPEATTPPGRVETPEPPTESGVTPPEGGDRRPVKMRVVRSEGDFVRSLANPDIRPELKRVKAVSDDEEAP